MLGAGAVGGKESYTSCTKESFRSNAIPARAGNGAGPSGHNGGSALASARNGAGPSGHSGGSALVARQGSGIELSDVGLLHTQLSSTQRPRGAGGLEPMKKIDYKKKLTQQ